MASSRCLRDVDGNSIRSIAVIEIEPNVQAWQYRLEEKGAWFDFPDDLSNTAAVLLHAGAFLRPGAEASGTISITFRAWDRTGGEAGATNVNILKSGDDTPFSDGVVTVVLQITAVNDPPQFEGFPEAIIPCRANTPIAPNGRVTDPDEPWVTNFSFVVL